jgi:hypothetical protein
MSGEPSRDQLIAANEDAAAFYRRHLARSHPLVPAREGSSHAGHTVGPEPRVVGSPRARTETVRGAVPRLSAVVCGHPTGQHLE